MSDSGILMIILVAALFALTVIGRINDRRKAAELRTRIGKAFGQKPGRNYAPEETARIPRYFEKHHGSDDYVVDDITAGDLDLFSLFARINYCRSASGEEVLYDLLRTPCYDPAELDRREQAMETLSSKEDLRLDLQTAFAHLGGSGKYSVYDYLDQLEQVKVKSNIPHYVGIAAVLGSAVLMIFYFNIGFPLLLVTALVQIVTYYRQKGESDAYLSTLAYILRLIICADEAKNILEKSAPADAAVLSVWKEELGQLTDAMKHFRKGTGVLLNAARMRGTGDIFSILADYIRMLLHLDLIKFNQMVREVGTHKADIDKLITTLGTVEALISVVCYRASLTKEGEGYCIPETVDAADGVPVLQVQDLRHALIEESAVPNSMEVKRSVLLTGSNASGKSTWLKSLAIAALMAQTTHTVCAASYRAPLCRIYSSMALTDNLRDGESYYIVEIRALARVLDAAKDKEAAPILCFVDEVLRGTNTIERIAASAQVLLHLSKEKLLLFAATHDLELTTLLSDDFDNYHFEGLLEEDDVHFDYLLKKGPAQTRNAIGLLKRFSYDREITERAEAMAARFEKTGEWSM